MQKTYIIPDPHEIYAQKLVEVMEREHGLLPVCVFTHQHQAQVYRAASAHHPSRRAVATFALDRHPPAQIADSIRQAYQVVAVLPFFEHSLGPMTDLAQRLGLSWNEPDVLRLFRDKAALKEKVARVRPDLPLGHMRRVRDASEVLALSLPEHYVVKPVDGFGNHGLGFFSQNSMRRDIEAYFSSLAEGTRCILEERFTGEEYAVNGQMDHLGEMILINITRYERRAANGRPNVYFRTHHVNRREPGFAAMAAYAEAIMRATGLRRCPFHMELMLTSSGPRLIEVGARFGGTHYALMSQEVHGPHFNWFQVAAHYYLHDYDFGPCLLDWDHYDQVDYIHQDGISHRAGIMQRVEGMRAIERMAGFRGWVVRPQLGARLEVTQDIYTVPYSFHMMGRQGPRALAKACDRALSTLRISPQRSTLMRLARLPLRGLGRARRLIADIGRAT